MQMSPALTEELFSLRNRLSAAPHGEGYELVRQFADFIGRSPQTIYVWLRKHTGYDTGRKRRSDTGRSRMPSESLDFIASAQREAVRGNGKRTMPLAVAMNVAEANGMAVNVGKSRVGAILRKRRMDAKTMQAARNHGALRSLHPNHVHQIDPSLCVLYYMNGQQRVMRDEDFYKNKPSNFGRVKLKVWRYVRYDHASGNIDVRYYEAEGESQASLFDFLLYTWGEQPERVSYGMSDILLWDKGSANTSLGICNLLDALGVDHRTHAPGHAWAKGGVEVANNIVETHFESRLRFEPVDSVEALNAAAATWVRDWNANAIVHVDSRLRRASGEPMVRDDLWQLIMRTPEALRRIPERKVCKYFLHGAAQTRQVRDLKVSFAHPEIGRSASYDLSPWAEFLGNKMQVTVTPLLLREGMLRVEIDRFGSDPLVVEVEPERDFDDFGRSLTAQVIGEGYSRASMTGDERTEKHLLEAAYGEGVTADKADKLRAKQVRPFAQLNNGRGAVAHSHLGKTELPQRLLPAGMEADTPALVAARAAQVELRPLSHVEAAKELKAMLGDGWRPADHFRWLQQRYPDGVQPDQVDAISAELRGKHAMPLQLLSGGK
ncbi:MAG: transposase [Proteobacteria bacterium]|nr:transposase [Pseudomonadota bacterium]